MKSTTRTATSKPTTKAKTKATATDATSAKLEAIESNPALSEKEKFLAQQDANDIRLGNPSATNCAWGKPNIFLTFQHPDKTKVKAWMINCSSGWENYQTSNPVRTMAFTIVLGKHDARRFQLSIMGEHLTAETAKLQFEDIIGISYPKWCISFKGGFSLPMDYCKITELSEPETRDDKFILRTIEEHFQSENKTGKDGWTVGNVSVIEWGKSLKYPDAKGQMETYTITAKTCWEDIETLMMAGGRFVKVSKTFCQRFKKGDALKFRLNAIDAEEMGKKGTGLYRLLI